MEYYNNDYLIHYGIKGMKWGVRREYRQDKKVRSHLTENAAASSSWSRQYDRLYKRKSKRVEKAVAKDLKNTGQVSARTKEKQNELSLLGRDRDSMNKQRRSDIAALEKHVNSMVEKYSDKKIQSVKPKVKDGEKYVRQYFSSYSYELHRKSTVGDDGTIAKRYIPTRVQYYYA